MGGSQDTLQRSWRLAGSTGLGLIVVAAWIAATTESHAAAWMVVATLAALVVAHLAIASISFRRTMRREWPRVEPLPLDDDEDDW